MSDNLDSARERMASAFSIFIYCDDSSHPQRRVAVTNFLELPGGGWHEKPATRASTTRVGSGQNLIGDRVGNSGWSLDPNVDNEAIRSRFDMVCRKCKRRPVVVKSETLFSVLDDLRRAGLHEIPLSVVAARLSK